MSPRRAASKDEQHVFVNRSINMANIHLVGFDMDHTLVVYDRKEFESLAFHETLKKIISAGYPAELAAVKFQPNFLIRGLLVDINRGNLLKVDCHKYVKVAIHGSRVLAKDDRHRLYNSESFKAQEFLSVDTHFAHSEIQLFCEIVAFMDMNEGLITKSYREVYLDLKKLIDLSHADGSIKSKVLKDPGRYIIRDRHLIETLSKLIDSGKDLFLLTNSNWEYTDAIMSYLVRKNGESANWREYFKHIIVSAQKPSYFASTQPFTTLNPATGELTPLETPEFHRDRVYVGGNAKLFQQIVGQVGDHILYVGDHIYGDIMRSKNSVNWRTLVIVEELNSEIPKVAKQYGGLQLIKNYMEERDSVEEDALSLQSIVGKYNVERHETEGKGNQRRSEKLHGFIKNLMSQLNDKQEIIKHLDGVIRTAIEQREGAVHPVWGDSMRAGLQRSRFADQIMEYACAYTSRVSNLRFYSPFKKFLSSYDEMPHERRSYGDKRVATELVRETP